MPWTRLDIETLKPVTETEQEVYRRGIMKETDELRAAALKAIKEKGEITHDPLVYEVTSFDTLAKTFPGEEDLVDRSILFYRMQGVRVLALKMTFNDNDYVVVYA